MSSAKASVRESVRRLSAQLGDEAFGLFSEPAGAASLEGRRYSAGDGSSLPGHKARKIAPEPADEPADPECLAPVQSFTSILHPTPHSLASSVFSSNLLSFISSSCSAAVLHVIFSSLQWVSDRTNLKLSSLSPFVGIILFLVQVLILRRKDAEVRAKLLIRIPVAVVITALIFVLAGGDVGAFCAPLVCLMLVGATSSSYPIEPSPKESFAKYVLSTLPMSIVFTLCAFPPAYAVAIPGQMLSDSPAWYTAWCGIGYPMFAFLFRKAMLSYFIADARKSVKAGKMTPEGLVPYISNVSFNLSAALMFGNIMLMYLSSSKRFALISSLTSVFTEISGKIYAVWATRQAMAQYLIAVRRNSALMAKMLVKANTEPGVRGAIHVKNDGSRIVELMAREMELTEKLQNRDQLIVMLQQEVERLGGDVNLPREKSGVLEEVDENDEKFSEEYWKEIQTMFALRWNNEIIAEKASIATAAYATKLIVASPHSTTDQIMIFLIFAVCELVADTLLVYCLDKYYGIPFLRLPISDLRDEEYWLGVVKSTLTVVMVGFYFHHAHESSLQWFPRGVVPGLLNATNATVCRQVITEIITEVCT
jgi:hypothetical protein